MSEKEQMKTIHLKVPESLLERMRERAISSSITNVELARMAIIQFLEQTPVLPTLNEPPITEQQIHFQRELDKAKERHQELLDIITYLRSQLEEKDTQIYSLLENQKQLVSHTKVQEEAVKHYLEPILKQMKTLSLPPSPSVEPSKTEEEVSSLQQSFETWCKQLEENQKLLNYNIEKLKEEAKKRKWYQFW